MSAARYVLTLSCANRPGIVATVSTALVRGRLQHSRRAAVRRHRDRQFLHARRVQRAPSDSADVAALRARFADHRRSVRHDLVDARRATRRSASRCWCRASTIASSICSIAGAAANCRWRSSRSSPIIRARPTSTSISATFPFHYLPVTKQTKMEQEAQALGDRARREGRPRRARALHADPVRRARGQAAAGAASTSTTRSCPASRARKPYHQAHERGVKLIGATAHFVTVRPRRRPDHRAGRRAHQPPRHARGPGAQGPRHRAPRAGARAAPITSRIACCSTAARRWCFRGEGERPLLPQGEKGRAARLRRLLASFSGRLAAPRFAVRRGFLAAAFFTASFFAAGLLAAGLAAALGSGFFARACLT